MGQVRFVVHGKVRRSNAFKGSRQTVSNIKDPRSRLCKIRVIPYISGDGPGSIFCEIQHVAHKTFGILGNIAVAAFKFFKIQTVQGNIAQSIYGLLNSGNQGIDFGTGIFSCQGQSQFRPLIGYTPGIRNT